MISGGYVENFCIFVVVKKFEIAIYTLDVRPTRHIVNICSGSGPLLEIFLCFGLNRMLTLFSLLDY